jgi:uncharacterized protein (DUF2249 family)
VPLPTNETRGSNLPNVLVWPNTRKDDECLFPSRPSRPHTIRLGRVSFTGAEMKIAYNTQCKPTRYTMELSSSETYSWTHRDGSLWPASQCSGVRLRVKVDKNGLHDYHIWGRMRDIASTELEAIIADHLPACLRHLWPTWED